MSRAKPMDAEMRALMYVEHIPPDGGPTRWGTMTPRQHRRWRHKVHRNVDSFVPYSLGKGQPTPRRPRRG